MADKLYMVKFMMDDFTDMQGEKWGKVPVTVFSGDEAREPLVSFEEGIKDYESGRDQLKEFSLRCLLNAEEAEKLAKYIKDNDGFEAELVEVDLPIDDLFPWMKEMDNTFQGFMGVSLAMCDHMGIRLAAYYDLRESDKWKEMNP